MRVPFIDLRPQNEELRPELDRVMKLVMDRSLYILGPEVDSFESDFGKYLGAPHCIACGNATDGLEIILRALEIGKGDEVIIPSHAWISVSEVVTLVGAQPVFVDVDPDFYTLDPDKLKSHINSATRAIMPVHLYGLACDMDPIKEVAQKYDLKLIEDCAQAHGVNYNERKAGTLGHASAFSFYPTKNLGGMGDGGVMVTSDPECIETGP